MLRPAEILGLPPDTLDLMRHLVPLRWALILCLLATAVLLARERRRIALLPGLAFGLVASAFWIAMLGRPYGLFVDAAVTRQAADRAVAAEAGPGDGFLVGEPPERSFLTRAAGTFGRDVLLVAPSWLPAIVLPMSALLLYRIGGSDGPAVALLWLAFSSGDLDTARGAGFVPRMWSRPDAAVVVVAGLALVAAIRPWLERRGAALAAALLLIGAGLVVPLRSQAIDAAGALLLLTADQAAWLVLGAVGLRRRPAGPPLALTVAGGTLVLASVFGWGDVWVGHALYRAGLVAAAVGPLHDVASALGEWVREGVALRWRRPAAALGAALLFAGAATGTTLAWWDPLRWDPVARDSVEPLSIGVAEPMDWIRRETPPAAAVLASLDYAPAVAVLGGRRVLRAPTLLEPADDERRRRLERSVLTGRFPPSQALLDRYGLRYVLAAPGDFREHGIEAPHRLEERGHLALRHVSANGFRVYEIVAGR